MIFVQGFNTVSILNRGKSNQQYQIQTQKKITNNKQKQVLADREVGKDPDKTRLHDRQKLTPAS